MNPSEKTMSTPCETSCECGCSCSHKKPDQQVRKPKFQPSISCECGCGCNDDREHNHDGGHEHDHAHGNSEQRRDFIRILTALILFALVYALAETGLLNSWFGEPGGLYAEFALFLVPYLIAGSRVLWRAARNIARGKMFDENFLMTVATVGAFALVLFPESDPHMAEGAAVMIFYQIGEFFEGYAVGKTRRSIADMMDIAPDYATIMRNGQLVQVSPSEVPIGSEIVVKPGERVPLDGVVTSGLSQLDTAALTGESAARAVEPGSEVVSGCVNMTGALTVRTTREYGDSTVQRILELVETAAEKKARTESFITRFARYYTPAVVCMAAALAVLPPLLLGGEWADWVQRGLIFLVVSCPCALVISVPLSFFGGIGAASRKGILVKGSNYLESLAQVDTVAFDKTGTLTSGAFSVVDVRDATGAQANAEAREKLLGLAAHAECFSNHPLALAVRKSYGKPIDPSAVSSVEEIGGRGVIAVVEGHRVLAGSNALLEKNGISSSLCGGASVPAAVTEARAARVAEAETAPAETPALAAKPENAGAPAAAPAPAATSALASGTMIHVAVDGIYRGSIVLAVASNTDAKETISQLHALGIKRIVMLTGDRADVAASVAHELGVDDYHAELLPQDKVAHVEQLLERAFASAEEAAGADQDENASAAVNASETEKKSGSAHARRKGKLAFVGDGINDAPVLMRADIGIAMGAMGSDAAIEAADVVLMDDRPSAIAVAVRIARKTMRIVRQNIVFALGVKFGVLALAALGIANLWLAVFADVGVAVLAVANAMRAMRI